MNVYIIRHGIAVDIGERGVMCDADRMLSAEGCEKTAAAARGLKQLEVRPDLIVTSPLVRARETAELVGRELGYDRPVEVCDLLEPGADPPRMIAWLAQRKETSIALTGHMPHTADLASLMLSSTYETGLVFKKAAAAAIHFDARPAPGRGYLLWHMPPRALRMLGAHVD